MSDHREALAAIDEALAEADEALKSALRAAARLLACEPTDPDAAIVVGNLGRLRRDLWDALDPVEDRFQDIAREVSHDC